MRRVWWQKMILYPNASLRHAAEVVSISTERHDISTGAMTSREAGKKREQALLPHPKC